MEPIEIQEQLEYVDEYCYLGPIISRKDQTKEINKRIANG